MSNMMTQEEAMNMSNEQAVQILIPMRNMMYDQNGCPISDAVFALDKAIEALSADKPQEDTVSRQYLLAEIDDLADEFSELDENGLHSERWCGIMDSRGVIVNTPSVSDRLQGEWVLDPNGMDWNIPAWKCSRCGFVANYIGTEANGFGRNPMNWAGSKYCPNCGVKMKGGRR